MRSTAALVLIACMCALSGCEEPNKTSTRQWAMYYVDRMHDTQPPESTETPAADSLVLDSVTVAWTTDDWIQFWQEVELEQIRRREAAVRLAEENLKAEAKRVALAEREAEARRQAEAETETEAHPDSVSTPDST